jgi:hypothetical protein
VPPLEAWEKVFIDAEAYAQDLHSKMLTCTTCHGGEAVDDMQTAHTGLVADPAAPDVNKCGTCHVDIATSAAQSLHATLTGYDTALYQRSSPENHPALETMESYHCESCHTTCGDCHISQPNSVGGGLLEGHAFVQKPPMSRTCTACHGSRVKNEYYGLNEGLPGDVHLRQARLACTDCHTADEMHGMGDFAGLTSRYDGPVQPTCESCHADDIGKGSGILQHELHGTDLLSCQACHSVAYTNCTNCHVDRSEDDVPFYTVESHSVGFYLGLNTQQSADRPWKYVPVRHVPVDVNSFEAYGENLLDNFLSRATWAYATPHNIQRNTPQTERCITCHGNDEIFLTLDKLAAGEDGGANLNVIVDAAPPFPENLPELLEQALAAVEAAQSGQATTPTGETSETSSGGESFWSEDSSAATPESESGESFWSDDSSAPAATATPAPTVEPTVAPTVTPTTGDGGSFWASDTPTPESEGGFSWGD